MSFSLILLVGILMIFIVLNRRKQLYATVGYNNRFSRWITSRKWFRNPWWSGLFLFLMNALYFGLTLFFIYLLLFVHIPYIHLFIMLVAVIVSILSWITIGQSWVGKKGARFKVGAVGSSFYVILFLIIFYMFMNTEPSYPGEDTFMESVGFFIGLTVTSVASITCFIIVTTASKHTRSYKFLLALLLFGLVGCSNEKAVEPDTPSNATMLMKHRIDIQNYEAFQQLFYEEAEDEISKKEFKELQEITTAGSEYREHMLVTFTNGEMLLVEFAAKIDEDENYEIINVKRVPEEVKAFFNSK